MNPFAELYWLNRGRTGLSSPRRQVFRTPYYRFFSMPKPRVKRSSYFYFSFCISCLMEVFYGRYSGEANGQGTGIGSQESALPSVE